SGHGDFRVQNGLRLCSRRRTAGFALLRRLCPRFRTPDGAIWGGAATAFLFTLYSPVYSTITALRPILLHISLVPPSALGIFAYGRTWTRMGPWALGRWFRPLAAASVVGCVAIIGIGLQPPNEKAAWVVGGTVIVLLGSWLLLARRRFAGPPVGVVSLQRQ